MNIHDSFPSKYLKAADLQGHTIQVVMDRVEIEDIGKGEKKPILYFQNKSKGLVLNKVNANNIASLYGADTDDWAGRQIVLFEAMVDFQGKTVPALRVRGPQPKDNPRQQQAAPRTQQRAPLGQQQVIEPDDDMSDSIPF